MVLFNAIPHRDTAELAQILNDNRPHPPRTFIPDLVEGAQARPCTGWMNLQKPPQAGWWATRQSCSCPPCYFYHLTDKVNNGTLPFTVAVPLAQLINVGLIRLNFRHPEHQNVFTDEDKDYALSLHRDLCYGINSGQLPLQLLEILLVASRKAVLKPLDAEVPEYNHREFEIYLKRAIQKCKDEGGELEQSDEIEQAEGGAHAHDEHAVSDESESNGSGDDESDRETAILWSAPGIDQAEQ